MEKSLTILLALKDHLRQIFPDLTSWVEKNDGTDVSSPLVRIGQVSFLAIALKTNSTLLQSSESSLKTDFKGKLNNQL